MKLTTKITSVAVLTVLLSTACKKNACDDPVPSLTYNEFVWGSDTAVLKFDFKDCDGDIGLESSDTLSPYNKEGDFYYNYKAKAYRLNSGVWELIDDNYPGLYSRIATLNDRDEDQVLEGTIEKYIPTYEGYFLAGDTIKFVVSITDRALNESNPAESDPIVVPN